MIWFYIDLCIWNTAKIKNQIEKLQTNIQNCVNKKSVQERQNELCGDRLIITDVHIFSFLFVILHFSFDF